MSQQAIEACVKSTLDTYFSDLRGTQPSSLYELIIKAAEKPLLEAVMAHSRSNQCRAAEWLGINRNTLRKKLLEHGLAD